MYPRAPPVGAGLTFLNQGLGISRGEATHSRPMGKGRGTLALLCLLAAGPAVAGTVYRCETAEGVPSYVSKRVPDARCTVVSRYRPSQAQAPRPAAPTTAPAATPASPVVTPTAAPVAAAAVAPAAPVPVKAASTPSRRLVQGQVYSYVKDGVRHYTSRRPKGGGLSAMRTIRYSYMETCYACGALPGINFGNVRLNTAAYQAEIAAAAREFGVDEAVVRAIIHAESAFNPNALSHAGAQGLMQLMPATARRFGVGNAFDAGQNIRGGVQYLAWLLKRFKGDLTLAAAGYNAGEGAVDRYGGVPPYKETQRYVQRVAVLAERYRGALSPLAVNR